MENVEKIIDVTKGFVTDDKLKNSIHSETDIINELGFDSLTMINFILKLEDEFNVEIDYENFDYTYLYSINKLNMFLSQQKIR